MTWPREQGHISRTKGRRPVKFSENILKGLKSSYNKNQISSVKNRGYRAQNLPRRWHPPHPTCGRGLRKKSDIYKSWDLLSILRPVSFISLWNFLWRWGRDEVATCGDRAEVYLWRHRSVTWPDLEMRLMSQDSTWIKCQVCQDSALYHWRVLRYCEKSMGAGWHPCPVRWLGGGWRRGLRGCGILHACHPLPNECAFQNIYFA